MNTTIQYTSPQVSTNKVLSQTYKLLALSMIPTVLSIGFSVSTGAFMLLAKNPIMGMILMMAGMFGFSYAIQSNRNNGKGVWLMMAFSAFMGYAISGTVAYAIGKSGLSIVATAAGMTGVVFIVMSSLAKNAKFDNESLGKYLIAGSIVFLIAAVVNIFLSIPALSLAISGVGALLFSAYLLHDIKRIIDGGETSYVSATLSIYLNIINIFTSLLRLLGVATNDD